MKDRYGLHPLSTGALFRAAIRAGTPLGRRAQAYIERGSLVPDDLVWDLAREALEGLDADDFILDGYPRTVQQATWLDAFLSAVGGVPVLVVSLEVEEGAVVRRLSRRRLDAATGISYHLDFNPPPPDVPAERIVQRADDQPEAIRQRLKVYHAQTEPVKAHYEARGLLVEVDGLSDIETVHRRLARRLAAALVNLRAPTPLTTV